MPSATFVSDISDQHNLRRTTSPRDLFQTGCYALLLTAASSLGKDFAPGLKPSCGAPAPKSCADLSSLTFLPSRRTASSLGLNLEDFNQRIKIHEHLANNILEHLAQQHQAISSRLPIADAVANCNSPQRQNELLKAELAATRKAHDDSATTTPPTVSAVNFPAQAFRVRCNSTHGQCCCR